MRAVSYLIFLLVSHGKRIHKNPNTFTEQDFKDAFSDKNIRHWNAEYQNIFSPGSTENC